MTFSFDFLTHDYFIKPKAENRKTAQTFPVEYQSKLRDGGKGRFFPIFQIEDSALIGLI